MIYGSHQSLFGITRIHPINVSYSEGILHTQATLKHTLVLKIIYMWMCLICHTI